MKIILVPGFVAAFICIGLGDVTAQDQAHESAQTKPLSVCEILAHPLKYDGLLVTIRDRVEGTDEGGWLVGDRCPGVFVTDGYVWPSSISLEMPTIPSNLRLHSVDFTYNWQSSKRVDAKYHRLLRSGPRDCMVFTYTGLFETRRDWSAAKVIFPNGTSRVIGFGHLNDAPAQLLMKSGDDVSLIPNCPATDSAKQE